MRDRDLENMNELKLNMKRISLNESINILSNMKEHLINIYEKRNSTWSYLLLGRLFHVWTFFIMGCFGDCIIACHWNRILSPNASKPRCHENSGYPLYVYNFNYGRACIRHAYKSIHWKNARITRILGCCTVLCV